MIGTLVHTFLVRAGRHPDRLAYRVLPRGRAALGRAISWGEWADDVRAVARALISHEVCEGDRILIFADNTPMWPIVDLGALMARVISVGAYPTSAPEQLLQQLRDCGARCVFVDTPARLAILLALRGQLAWPIRIVADCETPAECASDVCSLAEFLATAADGVPASNAGVRRDTFIRAELQRRLHAITPDDDALLIYTSGSTGEPKGARISHRYLLASAESIADTLALTDADSGVAFLPFCHAAERVFGLYVRVYTGMSAVLVETPDDVFTAARLFEPTVFGGLPRLFEKLAIAAAQDSRDSQETGARAAIARLLGTRVRVATSGGAALPESVAGQLHAAGLTVLGAYGQTEHLCIAMNRPDAFRLDAVGMPMPGTTIRIADDGELQVQRGPLTFAGYFGKPDDTRDAFTRDGAWLRTGDLAVQDPDGMLRLIGRRKEIIVLSNGKKVAPLPIETELAGSPLIARALCHGEGRHFLTALLQLERASVEQFAAEHHLNAQWPALADHAAVRAQLQAHVDEVNSRRSRPEQVRAFEITVGPWTVEGGQLTPTLKLKRQQLTQQFQQRLDAMYERASAGLAS